MREIKAALEDKEKAYRLKEDQLEAQKHQNESQLKSINEYSAMIAEFKCKEKISEWVPKSEFNQLNEEYTKLEKDLETNQEKLKSFAVEIAHLRQLTDRKVPPAEEVKLPEVAPPVIQQEKFNPQEINSEETIPKEINQEEIKLEEDKTIEERGPIEEIKNTQEKLEKKTEETEK
jgi:hypothetical protein